VDIAVALSGAGIKFQRTQEGKPLTLAWKPQLYVSYSGKRGVTLECVRRVKSLIQENPTLGKQLDSQMDQSVALCEKSLELNPVQGLVMLKEGIDLARDCFQHWGLTKGVVGEHSDWLTRQGALAVKPTGSGDGGFVLSLWKDPPPEELLKVLNPCF
jgi:mevalonate kinase